MSDDSFAISNRMSANPGHNVTSANGLAADGSGMDPLPVKDASLALPFGGKAELLDGAAVDTIFNFKACNAFSTSITEQVAGVVNQHFTKEAQGDQIGISDMSGVKSYSPGQLVADLKNADIKGNTGVASHGGAEH